MKVLIAPDKFKDSLPAEGVTDAIAEGLQAVYPGMELVKFPLADGGDGTARILTKHMDGRMVETAVHDPLFRIIKAGYGISGDGLTAFIEMSAASGLNLLAENERNCYITSSYGTGDLIRDAIHRGARRILLGIGGSATNDAGIRMAASLGYAFLDKKGNKLKPVGKSLNLISRIDDTDLLFHPGQLEITVACDVDNPLFGENGAAYVYAPQKGANPEQIKKLDKGLRNFASVVQKKYRRDISAIAGAGAAGGMGAGTMVFLNARLVSGIAMVMDQTGFGEQVRNADLIITGEGKLDEQTFKGKVVNGVCQVAHSFNKPVVIICGQVTLDRKELEKESVSRCFSLLEDSGVKNLDPEATRKNIIELIRQNHKLILA